MRWDDPTYFGQREEWQWLVSRRPLNFLLDLALLEHLGMRLWICTFNKETIVLNGESLSSGWSIVDGILVSPPLSDGMDVPEAQENEWYIFEDSYSRPPEFERFVGYSGFNLADP